MTSWENISHAEDAQDALDKINFLATDITNRTCGTARDREAAIQALVESDAINTLANMIIDYQTKASGLLQEIIEGNKAAAQEEAKEKGES